MNFETIVAGDVTTERASYTAAFKCLSTTDSSLSLSFKHAQEIAAASTISRIGTDFLSVNQTAWGNLQVSQHALEALKRGLIDAPRPQQTRFTFPSQASFERRVITGLVPGEGVSDSFSKRPKRQPVLQSLMRVKVVKPFPPRSVRRRCIRRHGQRWRSTRRCYQGSSWTI